MGSIPPHLNTYLIICEDLPNLKEPHTSTSTYHHIEMTLIPYLLGKISGLKDVPSFPLEKKKKENQHSDNIYTVPSPCWNWDYFKSGHLKLKYFKETCSYCIAKFPGLLLERGRLSETHPHCLWTRAMASGDAQPPTLSPWERHKAVFILQQKCWIAIIWMEKDVSQEFYKPLILFVFVSINNIWEGLHGY